MTDRERVLAILDGRSPDRIPWIPRLQVWHQAHTNMGSLPRRFEGMDLRQVERELGMGAPARGGTVAATEQRGDVEVSAVPEGESTVTTYRTPAGAVSTRSRGSDELRRAGIGNLEIRTSRSSSQSSTWIYGTLASLQRARNTPHWVRMPP